jgi:hypothetical protein
MDDKYLHELTKAAPPKQRRPTKSVVGSWVSVEDKRRGQACAAAIGISLSTFAHRALMAAIEAVEPALGTGTRREDQTP